MLTEEELARVVALPSTLGQHLGPQLLGRPYKVYPWVAYLERKVLTTLAKPGRAILIVNVPPQSGKLVTLDTPLATPIGWTTMGEIRAGDQVLGADGRPCNVEWVSETEWKPIHRIHFDDGSTIDAGPEHQWVTFDNRERSAYGDGLRRAGKAQTYGDWWNWESPGSGRGGDSKRAQTRTTEQLLASVDCEGGTKANHSIPNTHTLDLPVIDLPVDPWVLGYWLGNGTRGAGAITTGGHHLFGDDVDFVHGRTGGIIRDRGDLRATITVPGLITGLKALGIERTKAVPAAYLRASVQQRLSLLHGLMDSDGTNEASHRVSGQASFSSKDEHLTRAVGELVVTLGGKVHYDEKRATLNGVDYGPHYRVTFTAPFCPFSLPRKMALWASQEMTGRGLNRHHRKIVRIEVLDEAPMRCISVDGPGHLYLAGEQMVPTHNSLYMGQWLPLWYLGHNPFNRIIFVAYSENYASEWGGRVRDAMKWYGGDLFGVNVSPSTDSAHKWFLSNGVGGMLSAGIQGGITGNPGHLILVDDVIKTDEEANNPNTKAKHLAEFEGPITDRMQEDTKVFITATRWAEDDLSGSLIERYTDPDNIGGTPVEIVNFKAIAEPDPEELEAMTDEELADWTDFLGRHFGEALKGQHSLEFFEEMRANNPEEFLKKRQGTPTARKEGMFPIVHWQYWERLPEIAAKVRVWDLASSKSRKADWTCGVLMGRGRDGQFYVIDRQRFRDGPDGVRDRIKRTAQEDTNAVPIFIEQSRNGDGAHVISFYEKELVGFNVKGVPPKGDKTTRATGYSAEQNKGHVWIPKAWDIKTRKEWVNEHVQMDGKGGLPAHDDQIDPAAYAFNYLVGSGESILWDSSQLNSDRPELSDEARLHLIAVQEALGLTTVLR